MRQLKIVHKITNRESQSLDKYLQEIGRVDMISAEEEVELTKRIREGDQVALQKLVRANLRFVVSVAKQYQNSYMTLGDLINEGNVGLIKAAARFDETRGFKFISYAVWWIRQSIIQALAEHSRIVRLPMNRVSSNNRLLKISSELEQKFQREPLVQELADALDMAESEVENNINAQCRKVSIDAPFSNGEGGNLLDVMENDQIETPDAASLRDSLTMDVQEALSTLTSRESDVISSYYGLNGTQSMTLEEIGEQFSLTRERVRQIKEKATRKLRNNSAGIALKMHL